MPYQEVITIAAGVVSTGIIAGTEASGADAGKIVIEDGGTLIGGTIREGGALSAVYGAVVSDLTAETGAVVEISDSAKTSGALLTGENTNIAEGTLYYNGSWNLFDQIIISEPRLNETVESGHWAFWKSQVFNKPFLTVQEGKDKGAPLRTTKAGVWQNGYGDHFPTMIYLIRKK